MRILCIAPVKSVMFNSPKSTHKLTDQIIISNQWDLIGHAIADIGFTTADFQQVIGRKNLLLDDAFHPSEQVFLIYKYVDDEKSSTDQMMSTINGLLNQFWFVDDIPAHSPIGYFFSDSNLVNMPYRLHSVTNSSGDKGVKFVLTEEIIKSVTKSLDIELLSKLYPAAEINGIEVKYKESPTTDYYNLLTRVQRAIFLLELARSSSLLPMKIANFVNCLECLFALNEPEISYKVSQRVSFYLGNNIDEAKRISGVVTDGYKVRSKFFHGDELPSKADTKPKLQSLSFDLDHIIRLVLTKIVSTNAFAQFNNKATVGKYLNDLVYELMKPKPE